MKHRIAETATVCGLLVCLTGVLLYAGEGDEAQPLGGRAKPLLSADRAERDRAVQTLNAEYLQTHGEILAALKESAVKHQNDHAFHSPLHCAILAAASWHVWEAEDLLLSMCDYEIDMRTIPAGMGGGPGLRYPVSMALVRLRVDTGKVLDAVAVSKGDKPLRVLAWVLLRRAGNAEKAMALLEQAGKAGAGNPNLKKAAELLGRPSDLLPPPNATDKEG